MLTLTLSSAQPPLLPPASLQPGPVTSATAQVMRMLLESGLSPHIIADLLAAADLPLDLLRYLRGPLILPHSPWADSLPPWLPPAIFSDRLAAILTEYSAGLTGDLATSAEALAWLIPLSLDAPLDDDWQAIYRRLSQTIPPRHSQSGRKAHSRAVHLDAHQRARLRRLQQDIRRRVVAAAAAAEPAPPLPNLLPPLEQHSFKEICP